MFLCDLAFSLKVSSRFIHAVACVSISVLFLIAESYSIIWIHIILSFIS